MLPAHFHTDRMKAFLKEMGEFILGCAALAFCIGIFMGAIYLGVHQGDRDCWRGTARSVDCDVFGPCHMVNGHARIIDVELNYAKRHPQCQVDWSAEKKREAEVYWRGDGKDQ